MRDVFFVLLVLPPLVRVGHIDLHGGLDEADEGDQDGEAENGQTCSVLLPDVIEVNVGVPLVADHQNIALQDKLWSGLQES